MTMLKPTILPSPSDNDILVTNNAETTYTSTQNPTSTLSMLMQSTSTDSVEAGNAPLNMSNYKDGKSIIYLIYNYFYYKQNKLIISFFHIKSLWKTTFPNG